MNPTAFRVFGVPIQWYGILIATGILVGGFIGLKAAKRKSVDEDTILDLLIYAIPASLIGARAYYVIFSWDYYKNNPIEVFYFRHGGMAIHGALIAAIIVTIIFSRLRKQNFWKIADIAAPSLILGQAIGRWGNYINQEAYGKPTNLPWGILIGDVRVHPTFLYESILNFLIFCFLLWYSRNKSKTDGEVFLLYLILYSSIRVFIEGLRTDSLMWGPFRVAQLISLLAIFISIYILKKKKRNV